MAELAAEGSTPEQLAGALGHLLAVRYERQRDDPFGNPVLSTALVVSRGLADGSITFDALADAVRWLRDDAFRRRAARLAAYVGLQGAGAGGDPGDRPSETMAAGTMASGPMASGTMAALALRVARPDPDDSPVPLARFRDAVERTGFVAVFTAHPTFALPSPVYADLVATASGAEPGASASSHRPPPVTLEDEFDGATRAITRGRDALDRLAAALLDAARAIWPGASRDITPCPVVLASWVGYDTDGRTDIGWHDTIRLRLRMKALQIERLRHQLDGIGDALEPVRNRLRIASETVAAQIAACPNDGDPEAASRFAAFLVDHADAALPASSALLAELGRLGVGLAPDAASRLAVARAGLRGHGLSLALTHMRLNATQLHNVARQRLGISDDPDDPSRRRALLGRMNDVLDELDGAVPFDLGALLAEQASAARLMMVAGLILKHVDRETPIRFLIAETESGYTLLAALWLARLFGVERRIELSPLFETAEALERGTRVIDEALRSPHYRDYVRGLGRLCLQFGYSDSGRYVGQMAATYQIERLRLKLADLLGARGLAGIEVVLFDTHGESIGRGAHPGSLAARLDYLSPPQTRAAFRRAGLTVREEAAFQGGDGYALFGTPALADATVLTLAQRALLPPGDAGAADPIYDDPDFSADFFAAIARSMAGLVDDPGYAALLGAFGPALIDRTGSRPTARHVDGSGAPARIRHPRELRAIPNNAILQQLGWCANTLQGLGAAAARHPDDFERLRDGSARFRNALDFARHALAHSDRDVLRGTVLMLDPGTWLDRAAHEADPSLRRELVGVAHGLQRLDLWAATQAMLHRIEDDNLLLRDAWPDAPTMALREQLLHAVRLALIDRIWLLAARIPFFAPRGGLTRDMLEDRLLRLDIPAALAELADIFPNAPAEATRFDFREPGGPIGAGAYAREHATIFAPIAALFDLLREIGTAIMHENGAFG